MCGQFNECDRQWESCMLWGQSSRGSFFAIPVFADDGLSQEDNDLALKRLSLLLVLANVKFPSLVSM